MRVCKGENKRRRLNKIKKEERKRERCKKKMDENIFCIPITIFAFKITNYNKKVKTVSLGMYNIFSPPRDI